MTQLVPRDQYVPVPPIAEEKKAEAKALLETQLGFPVCGARNRSGGVCANKAGKGTDHLNEGRCRYHGGNNQSPLAKNWKHGRNAQLKTSHPKLEEKLAELRQDHDVFNLEGEIMKMRGLAEIMLDEEELLSAAKLLLDVSKIVERYHQILEGRKYVISIENVSNMMQVVQDAIFRHVPDEHTRHLIAQDLLGMRLSTGRSKAIEGDYTEVEDEDDGEE